MFRLEKTKIRYLIGDKDNPRILTDKKKELLQLSLRKYGLLSPIYVTKKGLILSGHQRTSILKELGEEDIYVNYIDELATKSFTNAINFMFNKELQEIASHEEFDEAKLEELREMLIKKDDVKDIYEALRGMVTMKYEDIIKPEMEGQVDILNADMLYRKGRIIIPVILNEKNEVVNGFSRLEFYNTKFTDIPVIKVAGLSNDVFRYITANYSVKGKEDNIRHEQRRSLVIYSLGKQVKRLLMGTVGATCNSLFYANFLKRVYPSYLEFGSGNAKPSAFFRKKGIDITLFEPFVQELEDGVSIKQTYINIKRFLDRLEDNRPFDLVNANSVLNSVPYESDREKVTLLLKFLSAGGKTLIVSSRNRKAFEQYQHSNDKKRSTATRILDTEDDVGLTFVSISRKTKVQTFHNAKDLRYYMNEDRKLEDFILETANYIFLKINKPIYRITKKELMEAVDMEFNFKYHDRRFTDLHQRAVKIFSDRYDHFKKLGQIL